MESLASLSGGRADEDDMAAGPGFLHLPHSMLHQTKDAIQVDGHCAPPLFIRHLIDGRVVGRPNTVVPDYNVHLAEALHSSTHQLS
jgi:hypothetical protein